VVDGQSFALAYHADGSSVTAAFARAGGRSGDRLWNRLRATSVPGPSGWRFRATPVALATDPVSGQLGVAPLAIQTRLRVSGAVGVDAVELW